MRRTLAAAAAGLAVGLAATAASAQAAAPSADAPVRDVVADASGYAGQLSLPVGGSRVLRFPAPVGRVMLGDPTVGDVIPLSDRSIYVLAKKQGATNLTVMARNKPSAPMATMDLRVGYDVAGLQRALNAVMPGEHVEATVHGDGVILTGSLSSGVAAARAQALAERYAPDRVVNLTSVRGAEQVLLSVKVAEVQRTALKQLGVDTISALWDNTGALVLQPGTLNPEAFLSVLGRAEVGDVTIQALFDALERRGVATTLAEPTLVALSGETALFFAGGEFPIPVAQTQSGAGFVTTIEYKQFGVSVGFTPTVYGDTINLAVAPEVSAIDRENSVVIQGFRVPGLTTRRAKTTVELRDGQSFAIAGLIRRDFTDSLRGVPGAASVPILGALFRSTSYQNNETEVVIVVTVHIAEPTGREDFVLPTDRFKAPNELELFGGGVLEKTAAAPAAAPVGGTK
ncbi:type II and III secretion system protein family protein [Caulobacter sp. 17J80-11]|uniref:type II and III secretion system protein family protein n=1 Tax=Caulobacter sp. 17J80-11 TaxID=2763502 RepID=UPI0016536C0B|nr:type II and III secretion system protein family protein [Caulobacter sp. 17J80-11]MBC6982423.1 type II and III secretion system protein family protein [Caulobacter sp. 17J80-11]